MKKEIWEIWLENEARREIDFQRNLKSKKIKKEAETKDWKGEYGSLINLIEKQKK